MAPADVSLVIVNAPGRYDIWFEMVDTSGNPAQLTSNATTVQVEEPQGADLRAYTFCVAARVHHDERRALDLFRVATKEGPLVLREEAARGLEQLFNLIEGRGGRAQ